MPDLLALLLLLLFQSRTACITATKAGPMFVAAWPTAIGQAGDVGDVAGTVAAIGNWKIAKACLRPMARAAAPGMQGQVLAVPRATVVQPALLQQQLRPQAMAPDDAAAIAGAAVAPRQ